jgi:8-oxo-dGTP pyrophosphatase MutT (NUDIX family)
LSAFTWPPEHPAAAEAAAAIAASQRAGAEAIAAAVLVPLFMAAPRGRAPAEREPHLVLTRRRGDLRRHAGEISFPGGRRDREDASLRDTALREAEEEIGLQRECVDVIGELPPTPTFATNYVIHPFVATIPAGVAWRVSAEEVDAVLELALSELRTSRTTTELERRGITFTTGAFVLDGNVIWGATARIIEDLLERLQQDGPDASGLALAASAAR